jgi:Tol biopolymer transport system component
MQADLLRGFKPDGVNPAPGRRVLAQPWHDSEDDNPPVINGPAGGRMIDDDGSFAAILPARRAMSWQLVDTNSAPIVRERYWVTFQPGEIRTCANCHGVNTTDQAGHAPPVNKPEALRTLLQWWKVVNLPVTPGVIIFQTARDGNQEIYSMNPDGSNPLNLTRTNVTDAIPRVSYDGKKVIFMSDRGHTNNMDIWTMNSDGSNLFDVLKTNLPGATIWGAAPNFDGSKIAYMGPHIPNNRYDIFTCNADGTGVTNLTSTTGDGDFPYWSYDGSKIVFGSFRENPTTAAAEEIYIMNANGSSQTRLTYNNARDFYPVISPDSKKIAFTSERDGHRQIYVMGIDGSGQTNISNNAFNEQTAYFSPDGKRMSFTSDRDGNPEVYVMNADGSNQTRITTNTVLEAYPAWGNTPPSPTFPPGDVNGDIHITGGDSLLMNQVLVNLRTTNSAVFAVSTFSNGDVNQNGSVTGADSLLINQVLVGLRSYLVTKIVPNVRTNTVPTTVIIYGIGFPTNTVSGVTIGAPVNLVLSNVVAVSREQITALVPAGGGIGTGTVIVVATPTNGVTSFGRFINK